jgi:hypothetical protein
MQTRGLVVAIALVLALAVAAPTIGATTSRGVIAENALDVAKDARSIAKSAKRTANRARGAAQSALDIANGANAAANVAGTKADNAQASANAAAGKADAASSAATSAGAKADAVAADLASQKAKSATAGALVTTDNESTYQDLGGPSVTVTVPSSGLIEVWAQATMLDGAASLYEDGHQVPDQDPNDLCSGGPSSPPPGPLVTAPDGSPFGGPLTVSTPGVISPFGCGSTGAPGSVVFKTSPGDHTYSLRYASCGCNAPDPAEISDRFLAVAPRP